eukprot:m.155183 g.155183  ORF g.155183 m.155183 type:complete len:2420 (+) comp38660_c0_seq5:905-8164(+)
MASFLAFFELLACFLLMAKGQSDYEVDESSLGQKGVEFYNLIKPLLTPRADVVFVIDASGSVQLPYFQAELRMIESILGPFDVSRDGNRVAVVTYSTDVHPDWWNSVASPHLTKCAFMIRLREIPYQAGWTNTGGGLVRAGQILAGSSRSGVNRVVITLTDGRSNRGPDAAASAASLRSGQGATLFALGFGGISVDGLNAIASSQSHVFFIGEPDNVDKFSRRLSADAGSGGDDVVSSGLCGGGCANGQCRCGRVSGVYLCRCNDGYFVGTSGQCEACPIGEFRAGSSSNCDTCIEHATTSNVASTSNSDCFCSPGYTGDPTVECTPVRCPDLVAPANGKIVGNCETTYSSSCEFECEEGYKLSGASNRTCQANQQWSGTPPSCEIQQCPPLNPIDNTEMSCSDGSNYTSTCTFNCSSGHKKTEGSSTRSCQSNLEWNGDPIQCELVECPSRKLPEFGILTPSDCNSTTKSYSDVCQYSCQPGYNLTLTNISRVQCKETGMWDFEETFECKDSSPPTFHYCPESVVFFTDPGADSTAAGWFPPEVEDNSGKALKIEVDPFNAENPFYYWRIGTSQVTYIARDSAGNIGTCTFNITVNDGEVPVVKSCPEKQQRLVGRNGRKNVTWDEPQFEDNSGSVTNISQSHNSGDQFPLGKTRVLYTAQDPSGNLVQCKFTVRVVPYNCEAYDPPENGALSCQRGQGKTSNCRISCNEGYKILPPKKDLYLCTESGKWKGSPKGRTPWPSCGKIKKAKRTRSGKISYPVDDCGSKETQERLKEEIKKILRDRGVCKVNKKCEIANVNIQCGEKPSKKRATRLRITFTFDLVSTAETDDEDDDFESTSRSLKKLVEDADASDLKFNGTTLKADNSSLEVSETMLTCGDGQILLDEDCVSCPVGTRHSDESGGSCLFCPRGYYQDLEAQSQCKVCPDGFGTKEEGRISGSECIRMCQPGTFSASGVETCLSCPYGSYQPEMNKTSCLPCPPGKTTSYFGAINETDCLDPCPAGKFSETGVAPCRECLRGTYQNKTNQRSCIACLTDQTTIEAGAQDFSQCITIDECTSLPCDNDGVCIDGVDSFTCICLSGFTGVVCETEIDECTSSPCRNGGTCTDEENGFTCDCLPGYSGDICETDVDECAPGPCHNNGTCVDEIDNFRCICLDEFKGRRCELKKACPLFPCQYDGTCIETETKFTCQCRLGYLGDRCEVVVDACVSVPCQNGGSCSTTEFGYKCVCPRGFSGDDCEVDESSCSRAQCLNGATCRQLPGSFECQCPPSFSGHRCESRLSPDFDFRVTVQTDSSYSTSSVPIPDMTAATMAFWIQTSHARRRGTVVSYASPSVSNAFAIQDYTGFVIFVNDQRAFSDIKVNDGAWHHVAVTWTSSGGNWQFFRDSRLIVSGSGLKPGGTILGGGLIVIGQDQDEIGGGFVASESMVGSVSQVNVWSRALSGAEIGRLYAGCNKTFMGDVAAWPDFRGNAKGAFQVLSSSSICQSINQCSSSSCQNGGECEDLANSFVCHCRNGYTGRTCDQLSGVCNPSPCQNGGECLDLGEFSCVCPNNFTGRQCEQDVDECASSNPCENGGQCVNTVGAFSCMCSSQFTRSRCEKDINECELGIHNCSQICRNKKGGYDCLCQSRYKLNPDRINCDDVDECSSGANVCQQQCVNTVGSFHCECTQGYQVSSNGISCEDLDECQQVGYCSHLCNNELGGYRCSCRTGYTLGADNSTCGVVSCDRPVSPLYGSVRGSDFTFGRTVRYSCSAGYRLNGTSRQTCQASGHWSSTAPSCRPVKCSFIRAPQNGSMTADGDDYQSVANFSCFRGNLISGSDTRQCQANGAWSGIQPTCTYVPCENPKIGNGMVKGSEFAYSFSVQFSCNIGYDMAGNATSVCLASGQWNQLPPKCHPVPCPAPGEIVNGTKIGNGRHYGETIRFECIRGYRREGSSSRDCQANGTWSGKQPKCTTILCRKLRQPLHGRMTTTEHTYGTTVTFSCKSGYRLFGSTSRQCTATGKWTGMTSKCAAFTCGQDFSASSGQIMSLASARQFSRCNWRITTPSDTVVTFQFRSLHLSEKGDCVEVRDGHLASGDILIRYCGPMLGALRPVSARLNRVSVKLFGGSFDSDFFSSGCGGFVSTMHPSGQLVLPKSTSGVDCYWNVRPKTKEHKCLQLVFVTRNLSQNGRIEIAPEQRKNSQSRKPMNITDSSKRILNVRWRSFWLHYQSGSGLSTGNEFKIVFAEGSSCADIASRRCDHGNGLYWIYPHAHVEPFQVYCDMTNNEGWTLVARLSNADEIHWSTLESFWRNQSQSFGRTTDPNDNKDMISEAFWMMDGRRIRLTRSDNEQELSQGNCLTKEKSTVRSYVAGCCEGMTGCSCSSIGVCSSGRSHTTILPRGLSVGAVGAMMFPGDMASLSSEKDFADVKEDMTYGLNVWVH